MIEVSIGTKVTHSRAGYGFNGYSFTEVCRETRTQWVCKDGTRYRKDGLRVVGEGYGTLTVTTEEHAAANRIYILKSKIGRIFYELYITRNEINIEEIERLKSIYDLLSQVVEELKEEKSK